MELTQQTPANIALGNKIEMFRRIDAEFFFMILFQYYSNECILIFYKEAQYNQAFNLT